MRLCIKSFISLLVISAPAVAMAQNELYNPLGKDADVTTVIGRLITSILGITGSIALLMFVYGGFLWLISAGNPDMVKKGKEVMKWAVLGLVVIVLAYTIVRAIVTALESGTI